MDTQMRRSGEFYEGVDRQDETVVQTPSCCAPSRSRVESQLDVFVGAGVAGRRVLVTGAGGSIGSELAKQIAGLGPAHLSLIDLNEFNLYRVGMDLQQASAPPPLSFALANVADEDSMRQVFMRERPDMVFHAAALKHVPLLEDFNIIEAVRTNVLGTEIVTDLCLAAGCGFVLVSTDKAVNPSSCMGLTKRVAELQAHDKAMLHPESQISVVRFGNVVDSSGSVVPLFRAQIARGGPVTITHPDMTRYMMTIKEAVQLTLAASCLPQSGFALYVLDMGEPVRIVDLALQMIEMTGRTPYVDVDLQFVGIRPGEKLHEELNYPWEALEPTSIVGIRSATPACDPRSYRRLMNELKAATKARDSESVKRALVRMVPQYVGAPLFEAAHDAEHAGLALRPPQPEPKRVGARGRRDMSAYVRASLRAEQTHLDR